MKDFNLREQKTGIVKVVLRGGGGDEELFLDTQMASCPVSIRRIGTENKKIKHLGGTRQVKADAPPPKQVDD